ncbi:MAG TPA: DUF4870 domain-containing protein [Pyrinomonadaceae bacterium]|nr:DUF4870 domain-containing protein [Pyrinomonadaceae bacterium]
MSEKRSKYDTDPLDPEFARRAEESAGGAPTADVTRAGRTTDVAGERPTEHMRPDAGFGEDATRHLEGATRRFEGATPRPVETPRRLDEATRRLEDYTAPYPSVFAPPTYRPPAADNFNPYTGAPTQAPHAGAPPTTQGPRVPYAHQGKPTGRHVQGLGLPENWAMILPYAPFYVGLVAALVELLLVPRHEWRTRFHAAQGLALQLSIVAISFLFFILRSITGNGFGSWLFGAASLVFLIISMIRVWNGEPHRIAPLDEFTNKINQRFEPRKQ